MLTLCHFNFPCFIHLDDTILFGNDTLSVCKACDLKVSEMIAFLNHDREHIQQGIFPEVQQSSILHSSLNFDWITFKALLGAPLKAYEILKVEETHLVDIIADEVGNEQPRMQEGPPDPKKRKVCAVVPNKGN